LMSAQEMRRTCLGKSEGTISEMTVPCHS